MSEVSYSDECRTKKAFQYLQNMVPLFHAVVKFLTYGVSCKLNVGVKLPKYILCYNTRDLLKSLAKSTSDCELIFSLHDICQDVQLFSDANCS